MGDDVLERYFREECAYSHVKKLADGAWLGVSRMLFTTALMVGVDRLGYKRRYCYEHTHEAVAALEAWDGTDDPPGPWLVEKPSGRQGPGMKD